MTQTNYIDYTEKLPFLVFFYMIYNFCLDIAWLFDYLNNPKYWDRQAWANSVDPDQMLQNAASDQGLQCLPLIKHHFRHINR